MERFDLSSAALSAAFAIDEVNADDKFQYCLLANAWMALIYDVCASDRISAEIRRAISVEGLYACIASADQYAKETLLALENGEEYSPSQTTRLTWLWSLVCTNALQDARRTVPETVIVLLSGDSHIALAAVCQIVLRFPKRFTIARPDTSKAISKFLGVASSDREYARDWSKWPGNYVLNLLRECLREVMIPTTSKGKLSVTAWKAALREYDKPGEFSSGAAYFNGYATCNPAIADVVWRRNQVVRLLKASVETGVPVVGLTIDGKATESLTIKEIQKLKVEKLPQWKHLSTVTHRCNALKWASLYRDSDYLYTHAHLYGYWPVSTQPETMRRRRWKKYSNRSGHLYVPFPMYRKRDVFVSPVPKDYETSRMVAPETPFLNVEASRVRRMILSLVTATGAIKQMPPEDQSLNRERARLGSIFPQDNPYCTLDLTSASDSIVRELFFDICPPEIAPYIRNAISDFMVCDDNIQRTPMLATSGSVLTPILQSCYFLAILRAACYLCGCECDVSCYNDDLICRRDVAQTVKELLSLCNQTVNEKKSFITGPFRESCGGEYLNGFDVSGFYWPRHAMYDLRKSRCDAWINTLQSIISMQHKLYGFTNTASVFEDVVLEYYPKMTYSPVWSNSDDLWAPWLTDFESERRVHVYFTTKDVEPQFRDTELQHDYAIGVNLANQYAYYKYLKEGPQYPDDLCRFLHCASIPRRDPALVAKASIALRQPIYKTE